MSQYFDHPNLNLKCGFELLKPYEKQNKEKGNEKRKKKRREEGLLPKPQGWVVLYNKYLIIKIGLKYIIIDFSKCVKNII